MKTNTYLLALSLVALAAAGGYYIYQASQHNPQAVTETNEETLQSFPKAILERPIIEKIEVVPAKNLQQSIELEQNITAMRTRQKQRDAQIQAYRQIVRAPTRLPDLPVIEPLQMPRKPITRAQIEGSYPAGERYTLPPDVMTKFTNETGLSEAEIDQAMNR